jgi:3-phenylpropionate/cinnamic acid dioxygenase small subunit
MSFDCQKICAVLYREARLLDDRQWDEWLACYAEDVTTGCRHGMTTTSSPTTTRARFR